MSVPFISVFSSLDKLIQVVYQQVYRFVIISEIVDDCRWTVYVGETDDGRWWKASWEQDDVERVARVTHLSDTRLAENLAECITKGEMCMENFEIDDEGDASLHFGKANGSKERITMRLKGLSPTEAMQYTTRTLVDIGLNAQRRRCQLFPSESSAPDLDLPPLPTPKPQASSEARVKPTPPPQSQPPAKKRKEVPPPAAGPSKVSTTKPASSTKAPQRLKGSSLANPAKKARKYQALEFGSDDE
ncbi:hypothetical protein CYLTODRAFT_487482 [Cylindrobasidium torrendii FP15055 ss-10]|uniref:Uncharacterized protein n=1 Tax=Cylindrobasidium torrendii FP15055 ss-10 TaxID=1314674 RepID=A0A0D7BKV2_9AGAR|nr:hypothetical protein CYLTODRAFT_487482 [Cylindrobasidium torrendii FP15055 ss-10]